MAVNSNTVTNRYYPRLSEVMTSEDLPDFLEFAQEEIEELLNTIFYKNLQFSKSKNGDAASYSLDIITKSIGLTLPFGLRFVLNPDGTGTSSISSFPISIQYQWQIFAFLRSFNLSGFSFDLKGFFELGLRVFSITDIDVLINTLNVFVNPDDLSISKYQQMVNDINDVYPDANLTLPVDQTLSTSLLLSQINDDSNILVGIPELMFQVYILDADSAISKKKLQQFYNLIIPGGIEDYIQSLIKPKIKATLTLSAGLEFPLSMLRPINADGTPVSDPNVKSTFIVSGATFYVDTEGGIGADLNLSGSLVPTYAQIANTGLVISLSGAKLDLSQTTNIPEATAAGYPVDFMGLYIQSASISFGKFGVQNPDPNKPSASIIATNMLIGTGGISGKITLDDSGHFIQRKFNSFSVTLDAFSLTFKQNTIVDCNIAGHITLDKFTPDNPPSIGIQVHFKDNGDFSITALPSGNFPPITLPGVFTLNVRSLTFGEEHLKGFYIEVAGTLDFIANIPVLGEVLPKGINITKLRIWDNGKLEFAGGGLVLPKAFSIKIGPVKMEVSHMGIGDYTGLYKNVKREYRYFSFDGMLNTGTAGVSVAGNGIKYYHTVDDGEFHNFIRIDGIDINIIEPGDASAADATFILKGHLSVTTPTEDVGSTAGTEYFGSVSVSLPKIGIAGSAGMRLDPAIPSFLVDIGLELSTALPLGPTGLGIYGFRGMLGKHYLPSKEAAGLTEDASWWDYYKAPNHPDGLEGIELDKFAIKEGLSTGAGITIATEFDAGFTFSSKLFVFLGIPELFVIQGQAGILRSRIGLNDKVDPPFSALIVIDKTSFTGNLSVNYHLPSGGTLDGKIFSLQGTLAMAFFFNNASGWYLNLGQDKPENLRIQAKILTLFKGYAYVMISAKGFKAGAGAGFNFDKSFGPVGVKLAAGLDLGAMVSFKPIQIGGFIQFGGEAALKFFWFKIGLGVQIYLGVEAPHPFNITGRLGVKIHTPWPLPNIHFTLSVSWTINSDKGPLLAPVAILDNPDETAGYFPANALNIMSGETFPINYVTTRFEGGYTIPEPGSPLWRYDFTDETAKKLVTIPLDSYIDIELLKPVAPGNVLLGGRGSQLPMGNTDLLPPVKGIASQVKHSYAINALDIHAWDGTSASWVPYHVYEAVTAIVNNNTGANTVDLATLPPGFWQFTNPNTYNKIRLLSQTMFTFSNLTDSATTNLDALNFKPNDIFCYEEVTKRVFVNWHNEIVSTVYPDGDTSMVGGVSFMFKGLQGTAFKDLDNPRAPATVLRLLVSAIESGLVIEFPEPVTTFEIDFGINSNDLVIYPIVTTHKFLGDLLGRTIALDVRLAPIQVSSPQQNAIITYDNINQPVNKVLLELSNQTLLDFNGNLLIGGYYELPDQFLPVTTPQFHHEYDTGKALMYVTLFNKSFTPEEVLQKQYADADGVVAQWRGSITADWTGTSNGILSGSPDLVPGYFFKTPEGLTSLNVFSYTSNTDGLMVPFTPALKVEGGSFAVEVTAIFNPYEPGISTLLSKIYTDAVTGLRKGYALHLYQQTPGDPSQSYTDPSSVPSFDIWLSCYNGSQVSGIKASVLYTLDATNTRLLTNQYKDILVSVDRTAGTLSIYADRQLITSASIPAELGSPDAMPLYTDINQLSYLTEALQASQEDNNITQAGVINEVELLGNNLNKTIQPVWRPNTTFAVTVSTTDTVDGNDGGAINYTQIFGFKTAGPVGLFQEESAVYQSLAAQDRADEFKLANLRGYIDFDRSSPDAQGRYNLSKPVFYANPQISLFFNLSYMNAMYSNWDSYQGLPPVQSSLQLTLMDSFGNLITPTLQWVTMPDPDPITDDNYTLLPPDQQLLYLMNRSAARGCTGAPQLSISRNIRKGTWQIDNLLPGKLYTAIFSADYTTAEDGNRTAEVHKYSFLSSIFGTFGEQVGSFILEATPGAEKYALYPLNVAFTAGQVSAVLLPLLNSNPDGDSPLIAQYAVQYDRIVYGGMKIKAFEPSSNTIINPVINTDPASGNVTILGIIIRNPEPFNDPKLPADELVDTIQPTMTLPDNTVIGPDDLITIYSGDTSAVLITNAAMQLSPGSLHVSFRYKVYDGFHYVVYDSHALDGVAITAG